MSTHSIRLIGGTRPCLQHLIYKPECVHGVIYIDHAIDTIIVKLLGVV